MNKEIKNMRDLLNDEELLRHITEDITEIPEDTEVSYEVWAIGYDEDGTITDSEVFIEEFKDPDKAIAYANKLTVSDIVHKAAEEPVSFESEYADVEGISIEVETVVESADEDGMMNIGTIYKRYVCIDDELGTNDALEVQDPIVKLTESDYVILDDGTLKVRVELLENYKKNDYVRFNFVEEDENSAMLTYKIISKAADSDGDYFLCEFTF